MSLEGTSEVETMTPVAPKPPRSLDRPPVVPAPASTPEPPVPQREIPSPVSQMHSDPRFQKIEQEVEENWKHTYGEAYKPKVGALTRRIIAERLYRKKIFGASQSTRYTTRKIELTCELLYS